MSGSFKVLVSKDKKIVDSRPSDNFSFGFILYINIQGLGQFNIIIKVVCLYSQFNLMLVCIELMFNVNVCHLGYVI